MKLTTGKRIMRISAGRPARLPTLAPAAGGPFLEKPTVLSRKAKLLRLKEKGIIKKAERPRIPAGFGASPQWWHNRNTPAARFTDKESLNEDRRLEYYLATK